MPVGRLVLRGTAVGAETYHSCRRAEGEGLSTTWRRGWLCPNLPSNEEALRILVEAIEATGGPWQRHRIAVDPASSEFYKDGNYVLAGEGRTLDSSEMVAYWWT